MKKHVSHKMKKYVSRTLALVLAVMSIVTSSMVPTASAAGTLQLPALDYDEEHCSVLFEYPLDRGGVKRR